MLKYYYKIIMLGETIINIVMVCIYTSKGLNLRIKKENESERIHILGNGPSLMKDITEILDFLKKSKNDKVMVVNSFANYDLFEKIKPSYYILADPAFFIETKLARIEILKEKIANSLLDTTDWDLILLLPSNAKKSDFVQKLKTNKHISIHYFKSRAIIGGFQGLNNILFKHGLASPLYQNVLIPSIFLSIKMGYSKIILWGADHSWHEGYTLGRDNNIHTEDKHFYSDSEEGSFIHCNIDGTPIKVHEIFSTLSRAFKIYQSLESFSKTVNCNIFNLSSKTWIDAFKREY